MTKQTVWSIEPHTVAKHELLKRYLDAWFPILSSWNERVLFIDGFAGPGHYESGEPGSPRVAVESALRRQSMLANSRVMFLFNESDSDRFAILDECVPSKRQLCRRISVSIHGTKPSVSSPMRS
ncbi:three-Cys-motif partner protein TcmP [Rhodococcus hoagii]|nr:three-Cys-motif partner protein TcmP [Prescottella equi]